MRIQSLKNLQRDIIVWDENILLSILTEEYISTTDVCQTQMKLLH